jgi:hypothetical protein
MGAGLPVALIAATKLAMHLYAGQQCGYFVDELYYLACARHLEVLCGSATKDYARAGQNQGRHAGQVISRPLIAAIARIARVVLGDSLLAIRLFGPSSAQSEFELLRGTLGAFSEGRMFVPTHPVRGRRIGSRTGTILRTFPRRRNHQGKGNVLLFPEPIEGGLARGRVECRSRLGGLLRYYARAA